MITVLYFARLRENLGKMSESLTLPPDVQDIAQLCLWLQKRGNTWQQEFSKNDIRVAVNQEMVSFGTVIKDGDEIAFFPPITGG